LVTKIAFVFALAQKQARKAHQMVDLMSVSKACTKKLYNFRSHTYIVYLWHC